MIKNQFSSKNRNKYTEMSGMASFCSPGINLLQVLKFTLNVNFLRKLIHSHYTASSNTVPPENLEKCYEPMLSSPCLLHSRSSVPKCWKV